MKKLLSILLVMCLFPIIALAGFGEEPEHYAESVVDSQSSVSKYDAFNASGELSIIIPGLSQDFVPQGLAYYAEENLMLFSGYSSWGSSSMLLAVDMQTNQVVKEILLAEPNGDPYTGHASGVCVTDTNIFVSSGGQLYRLPLSDFRAAAPMDVLGFADTISVPCKASFCQVSNGVLWVGEFNYDGNKDYSTDKSHYIDAKDGKNKSWILGYNLVNGADIQINPAGVPDYVLSITDRIQGVTFCNDMIYLSQSYNRTKDSTIYRYKNVLANEPDQQVNVLGSQRPLWILDSESEDGKLVSPPMTESLCTIGDSVFVSFESAAYKFLNDSKPPVNPIDRLFKLNPSAF